MTIDQIQVSKTYYSCEYDKGHLQIKSYFITKKNRWSVVAGVSVCRIDSDFVYDGVWNGYPDYLYRTPYEALEAVINDHNTLKLRLESLDLEKLNLVNPVNVVACCETCLGYVPEDSMCKTNNKHVDDPGMICKNGNYKCDPVAINKIVAERQMNQ